MRSGTPQTNRGESKAVRTCFRIIIITLAVLPLYFLGRPILWHLQGKISEWREDWSGASNHVLLEDGGDVHDFSKDLNAPQDTQESPVKDKEVVGEESSIQNDPQGDEKENVKNVSNEDNVKADQGNGQSSPEETAETKPSEVQKPEEEIKQEVKEEEKSEAKNEAKEDVKAEVSEEAKSEDNNQQTEQKQPEQEKKEEVRAEEEKKEEVRAEGEKKEEVRAEEAGEKASEQEQKTEAAAQGQEKEGNGEASANQQSEKTESKDQETEKKDEGEGSANQESEKPATGEEKVDEKSTEEAPKQEENSQSSEKEEDTDQARNIIREGRPLSQLLKQPIWTPPPQGTAYPAKEEFALRREMVEHRATKNVIIVTFANFAFMDFVTTWVRHLTDLGLTNILVGAMDEKIMEALFWQGVPVFDMDSHMAVNDVGWGSPIFHKMGREKVTLVSAFLNLGFEILMCDTDMVFLRDPVEYMARFPDADVITSSDNLVNSVDDESLEDWMRAQGAYNIGILHFRPTPPAIAFVREWNKLLVKDSKTWDQNGFNDIMRKTNGPNVEGGSKNLFYAYDGRLKLGILPVSIFCSGHTFFVQRMHKRLSLEVFAVHTTFQFAGTEGKRHRLREATYFHDPPEYYDPPGGLLKYTPQIPENILRGGNHTVKTHFQLVNFQYKEIRTALAIASVLGRTLILPEIWCRFDRIWYPHNGILDGVIMPQPFLCPADHVLEVNAMLEELEEDVFGKTINFREYSLLDNPRMNDQVKADKVDIKLCKPGSDECGKESSPKIFKLKRSSTSEEIKEALKSYKDTKLLLFSTMDNAFGGFTDKEDDLRFRRRVNRYSAAWCCVNANPGHIWYDLFWDEKENWEPHPPKNGEDHRPNLNLNP